MSINRLRRFMGLHQDIHINKNKFPNAKPALWIKVEDVQLIYPDLKKKGVTFLSEPSFYADSSRIGS